MSESLEARERHNKVAMRFRERKKKHVEDVELATERLESENAKLREKISKIDTAIYLMKFEVYKNVAQWDLVVRNHGLNNQYF